MPWTGGEIAAVTIVVVFLIAAFVMAAIALAFVCCCPNHSRVSSMLNRNGLQRTSATSQVIAASSTSTVLYPVAVKTTGNGIQYNSTTGVWTVCKSAWYSISYAVQVSPPTMVYAPTGPPTGGEAQFWVAVNGSDANRYAPGQIGAVSTVAVSQLLNGSDDFYLKAGDTVEVRANNTLEAPFTILGSSTVNYVNATLLELGTGCAPPPCPPPCSPCESSCAPRSCNSCGGSGCSSCSC
jgi:hypothetical protein